MNSCNRCEFYPSHFIIIALSVIAGIIAGVLFFFLPVVFIKIVIAIGLALAILFLVLISIKTLLLPSYNTDVEKNCLCINYNILLFGITATIIISLIAIASILTIFNIFAAIIVGIWVFAFILMLGAFINLLLCIKNKECQYCNCQSCNTNY